ncbi:MAG: cyclic nucleotide-binding domain-containing protein [Pseudomonadota bacterium]
MQSLRTVPLFSSLTEEELTMMAQARQIRTYPANATIINDGDTTNALYIINKGKVKVCISNEQGREVVIAQLAEGEHFGEMSLIDEKPRSASIITRSACEISLIQKDDFHRMLASNPELSLAVMRGLSERLRKADRKIETLALMDVYGRIARALLDMAVECGDGRMVIEEKLTQSDLASMVGSSREMVNRILKGLTTGGYITRQEKQIYINTKLPPGW